MSKLVTFRKATQEDMEYVRDNPFEKAVKSYHYMTVGDENSFTGLFEGEIVGIGGLVIKWEGVGLFWLMLTAKCRKQDMFGIIALHALRDKISELIEKNNLWRAEATVRIDFPKAIQMLEFFGFQREGLMRMYCPDKGSVYLYSKIME